MPRIEVDGVGAVNMVAAGPAAGCPVVLLHPVGLDLTWWGDQFAALAEERRVVAFDMPGHGRSDRPVAAPGFRMMTDVLEGVLDAVGGRPAHVVGMSVGGMIAQHLALRRPERVRSLTLVATLCALSEEGRSVLRERARVAREEGMERIALLNCERWFTPEFRRRRPDVLDRVWSSVTRQDRSFHGGMWEMIAGLDVEAGLSGIACPTLVVAGSEDGNAPPSAGAAIADRIPRARLQVMPGVGHLPPLEVPDAFNGLLRGFLSEVEQAG